MSESNKFTPGPWTNMPRMECVPICGQHEVGLSIGFITSSNPDRMAEGKANATLIAAAPDLLEALDALVKINEDHHNSIQGVIGTPPGWNDSYLDAARKALSKARGQQ